MIKWIIIPGSFSDFLLSELEALSTVFTAAIKAIEAELRSGGGLDTSQRKFLRETYSNAGRDEEIWRDGGMWDSW